MSYFANDDEHSLSEINVTPLVDVMLVLLIVFMVTMPVLTHSIVLSLPSATKTATENIQEPLRLAISAAGEYYLGEQKISVRELKQQLLAAKNANPQLVLALAADKKVAYDYVAQALQAAQFANIDKIGFVSEEEP